MKFYGLLVLVLLMAFVMEESEAFRFRRAWRRAKRVVRKIVRVVKKPFCRWACPKVCPIAGSLASGGGPLVEAAVKTGCHLGCKKICKRSIALPDFLLENGNYEVVPMSPEFSHYDLDGDKLITMEEFSRAELLPYEEVEEAYQFADANGDGVLEMDEFETAPFIFTAQMAEEMNNMAKNVQPDPAQDSTTMTDEGSPDTLPTDVDYKQISSAQSFGTMMSPANTTSTSTATAA